MNAHVFSVELLPEAIRLAKELSKTTRIEYIIVCASFSTPDGRKIKYVYEPTIRLIEFNPELVRKETTVGFARDGVWFPNQSKGITLDLPEEQWAYIKQLLDVVDEETGLDEQIKQLRDTLDELKIN